MSCHSRPGPWQERLRALRPTHVIHLAGGGHSGDDAACRRANVETTRHLVEALRRTGAWLAVASSSAVYGAVPDDALPITEKRPRAAGGPYATSKAEQEDAASRHDGPVCLLRIANAIGPGLPPAFVLGRLAHEVARVGADPCAVVATGPLGATRDFVDVRDIAAALVLLCESVPAGCFNLGSGLETQVRLAAARLWQLSGALCRLEEAAARETAGIPRQVLDCRALAAATGWAPVHGLDRSLVDMVRWCRHEGITGR